MSEAIKQVFRSIQRQPLISFVNIFGLALGLFVFLLIDRYISFESSFDNFHPESESIYRVGSIRYTNGEIFHTNIGAMPPLKPLLEEQVEELEASTQLFYDGSFAVQNPLNHSVFEEEKAYYADKSFFEIFGFNVVNGNPKQALEGPRKAAISRSTAIKYFGTDDVLGKTLRSIGQTEVSYQITAVYSDAPFNSHFKPDLIFSFDTYLDVVHPDWSVRTNWAWNDFPLYIKIPEESWQLVQNKVNQIADDTWGNLYQERNISFKFELKPIQKIHTHPIAFNEFESGTDQKLLTSLRTVSWFILFIAWINFINLSTATSIGRAKEVGIRKVSGASNSKLIMQFLKEFLIIHIVAMTLALILLYLTQPLYPALLGFEIPLNIDYSFWLILLALLAGSILISLYPSLLISNINTRVVLKGKAKTSKKSVLVRKLLVYAQFILTPVMIGCSVLVYQQTSFLMNRQIGVDIDEVISINGPRVSASNAQHKEDFFKEKIVQSPYVKNVSNMMLLPGENIYWKSNFRIYGDSTEAQYMTVNLVEYDFEDVLDIQLLAGRSFSINHMDSSSIVINESAAKMWGYTPEEIMNKTMWWRYSPNYHHFDKKIIGVIADHKQLPYSNENTPMAFSLRRFTPASFAGTQFVAKLEFSGEKTTKTLQQEISKIETLWQELFPDNPFNYSFLNDEFEKKFLSEIQFGKLFNFFTFVSIWIAAMGLFGLSLHSIMVRVKEFGIRKSLGATSSRIASMIIFHYMKLVCIAYLFATPILYLLASKWLENYAVRININTLLFLIPIIITLAIGLISIIIPTVKFSSKNPIDSLRHE